MSEIKRIKIKRWGLPNQRRTLYGTRGGIEDGPDDVGILHALDKFG